MRKWNHWRTAWVVWIGAFIVMEGAGIIRKFTQNEDDNTLSEFVWDFITIHPLGWVGIAVLLGWLIKHFLFENENNDT